MDKYLKYLRVRLDAKYPNIAIFLLRDILLIQYGRCSVLFGQPPPYM